MVGSEAKRNIAIMLSGGSVAPVVCAASRYVFLVGGRRTADQAAKGEERREEGKGEEWTREWKVVVG